METPVEVIGFDHVYLSVRDLAASGRFYDEALVAVLGFRRNDFALGGARHVQYYNRQFGIVIRPARSDAPAHDSLMPGLHHLCLRVEGREDVERAAAGLVSRGIAASPPRLCPEYAPDYWATFFTDPDGIRLEVTNFREQRKRRMYEW